MAERHKYSPEQIAFLKKNVRGRPRKELTIMFNDRFGLSLSLERIVETCKRYKLNTGRDTRFLPGQEAPNKGRKCSGSGRATWFPKGFTNRYFSRKAGKWTVGPYLDRKQLMKKLCKKAGLEYFRYHAIRHSGASALEKAGVSITAIQNILGHESRQTTEIYLHLVGGAERQAMEIFEKLK